MENKTDQLNIFTLKLKLDRHKIKYSISEDEKHLTLGGADISSVDYMLALLPIVIGAVLMFLILVGILPYNRYIIILGFLAPIGFGIYRFGNIYWKKSSNKNLTSFSKDKVRLTLDGKESSYSSSDINSITYNVDNSTDATQEVFKGNLYLNLSGKRAIILGLTEKDRRLLSKDLDYFKNFLSNFIKL